MSLLKDHQETSSAESDRENWDDPDFWILSATRNHVSQCLVFNTPNGIRPLSGYTKSLFLHRLTRRNGSKICIDPNQMWLKVLLSQMQKWFYWTLNENNDSISLCTQFWVINSFIALQRRGEAQFHHRSRQLLISYLGLLSLWASVLLEPPWALYFWSISNEPWCIWRVQMFRLKYIF